MKKACLTQRVTTWIILFWYILYLNLFWHSVLHFGVKHLPCVSQPWPVSEVILSPLFMNSCSASHLSVRMKGCCRPEQPEQLTEMGNISPCKVLNHPPLQAPMELRKEHTKRRYPTLLSQQSEVIDIENQTNHSPQEKCQNQGSFT